MTLSADLARVVALIFPPAGPTTDEMPELKRDVAAINCYNFLRQHHAAIAKLEGEVARLRAALKDRGIEAENHCRHAEAMEQRAEAAEQDAARYRWLRHGDNDERVMRSYGKDGLREYDPRFDGSFVLRNQDLDAAIDTAIAQAGGK